MGAVLGGTVKLSIIICLYNSDRRYFEQCVRSIRESTLSSGGDGGADYELCVYDDGSTVDYSDIIEKYSLRYEWHENRGILGARLAALDMAQGEYIAFVDSDDSVSFNYHRPMLERAEQVGADVVLNDWAFDTATAKYICSNDITVSENIDLSAGGEQSPLGAFLGGQGRYHSWYVLWNKVYRASLMRAAAERMKSIEHDGPFNYSEDALLNFYIFKEAKRVVNIHTGQYFYRVHESQSVTVASEQRLRGHIECMAHTLRLMREGLPGGIEHERMLADVNEWAAMMSRTHYSHAHASGYTELYPLIKESYGVTELRRSTAHDGRCYTRHALLPKNVEQREAVLYEIWRRGSATVGYRKGDGYAAASVAYMTAHGADLRLCNGAELVVPKKRFKLRSRVLHNYVVFKLGMLLFKKGSRMRKFLKRFA